MSDAGILTVRHYKLVILCHMFVIFMRSYVSQGCETKSSSCSNKYVYRVTTSQVNIDLENRQSSEERNLPTPKLMAGV